MRAFFFIIISLFVVSSVHYGLSKFEQQKISESFFNNTLPTDKIVHLYGYDFSFTKNHLFQNCVVVFDNRLEIPSDIKLTFNNCLIYFEEHYDLHSFVIQAGVSDVVIRNSHIASYEEREIHWYVKEDSKLVLDEVTTENIRFYAQDDSTLFLKRSQAYCTVTKSSNAHVSIKLCPSVALNYETGPGIFTVDLPTGSMVLNKELFLSGHTRICSSTIESLYVTFSGNSDFYIRNCSNFGFTYILTDQEETVSEIMNTQYLEHTFTIGSNKIDLFNSRLEFSSVIVTGEGALTIKLSNMDRIVVEDNSSAEIYASFLGRIQTRGYAIAILYNSKVEDLVTIGEYSNIYLENSEISSYTFNNRFKDFFFYSNGKKVH